MSKAKTNVSILNNLATAGGAALVGFVADGDDAVARTEQDKSREWYSDADVGITGSGDETTKLLALMTYCVENGKQALLTKSAYTVSGNILAGTSRTGSRTLNIHCQVPVTITVDSGASGFDRLMYLNTTGENNVLITGASLTVECNSKCGSFLRADHNGSDDTGIVDISSKVVLKELKKTAGDTNSNGGMLFLGPYKRITIREPEVDAVDRTAAGGSCYGIACSQFVGLVEIHNPRISRVLCTPGTTDADGVQLFGKPVGGVLTDKRQGVAVVYGGVYTDNQGRHIKSQCSETTIFNPTSVRQNVVTIAQGVDWDLQCGNGLVIEPTYIYKKNAGVTPLGASFYPVVFQQLVENEEMSAQSIGGKMVTEVGMLGYCAVMHSAGAEASTTKVKGLRAMPSAGLATSVFTTGILVTAANTIEAKSTETTLEVSGCSGPMACYAIAYSAYGSTALTAKLNIAISDNTNTLTSGTIYKPFYKSSGTTIRAIKSLMLKNNTGFTSLYTELDFTVNALPVGCAVTVDLSSCTVTGGPGWAASGYATFHCVDQYFGATGKGVWAIKGSAAAANTMYWTQDGGTSWGAIK
jgi:hypothetical protein